ncbi:MAG TPA: helix-turn-helix domain-containing protein [Phenylobacterium sp.]|jgi:predicted DNA-binding transcriptional regulator AlpA
MSHAVSPSPLLSVSEAANFLGVSASFLNKSRLPGGGGPVFVKIGTRVSYDLADLLSWLEARKRRSTAGETAEMSK